MRFVKLDGCEPVAVAETFWERLRGLVGRPVHWAMLLPSRSVHSVGLRRAVSVAAVDAGFRVLKTTRLEPMRIFTVEGARWMLELPEECGLPIVGEVLRFSERSEFGERSS